jgi:sugar O-acyltransferase (sialic acid O-acetyltransferase NeuD family)
VARAGRERLLIVGAGGFARETADAVHALNREQPRWDLLGFVDDDPGLHGSTFEGTVVLGPIDAIVTQEPDARVVVCVGRPGNYFSRARIVHRLGLAADRYATIVHPAASIASSAEVGCGTVMLAGCVVTAAARIGEHVAIMPASVITHDCIVSDYVTIGSGVRLGGGVHLGTGAYVGAGALVREQLRVGSWSLIGIGAVVVREVPRSEVWFGTPAVRQGTIVVPDDLPLADHD